HRSSRAHRRVAMLTVHRSTRVADSMSMSIRPSDATLAGPDTSFSVDQPTLVDVAREAGVSRQTVSRVINRSPAVAPATRQRILSAMRAVGYRQNRIASSLRTGRSGTIGFVLSNVMNPFFAAELRGAQDVLEAHGYRILVCNTDEDPRRERHYLGVLHEQRVD